MLFGQLQRICYFELFIKYNLRRIQGVVHGEKAGAAAFGEILDAADKLPLEDRKHSSTSCHAVQRIAGVISLAGILEMLAKNSKRAGQGRARRMIFYRKSSHEAGASTVQLLYLFSSRLIRKHPGASEDLTSPCIFWGRRFSSSAENAQASREAGRVLGLPRRI